ncbi:hypothetical protein MKX01_029504, partial [Papaver californicum]
MSIAGRKIIPPKRMLRPLNVMYTFEGFAKGSTAIEGIKDIIAVASGKGGVGKSTTAVNFAIAFAKTCQLKVGLLIADVYEPICAVRRFLTFLISMFVLSKMIPVENHGVQCMSIGFLVEKDAPVVRRGPT